MKSFEHFSCQETSSFLFAVAVGGDGAPGIGMPVFISFVNVAERIVSSVEQFLLFGADVDENSDIATIFFEKLVCDLDLVSMQEILLKKRCFDYQKTTES